MGGGSGTEECRGHDNSLALLIADGVATTPDEVVPVLKESLKIKDKPVFMDFVVDWKEKVYPMVPAGAAIDEMIFEEEKE